MTTSRLVRFTCALVMVMAAAGAACSSSTGDAADAGGSPPWGSDGSASSADGAAARCGAFPKDYSAGNGSVTYYTLGSASAAVNCSFDVLGANPDVVAGVATGAGQLFGAMNTADYAGAATCGACVEITRDGARKVVVTIVDQCPASGNTPCKAGHIDLSQAAFEQLGMIGEGYLGTGNGGAVGVISWRYVACPVTGDIQFRLKDPSNAYWNQVLVESHRYPVAKVEVKVNGTWQSATRQPYNYWQVGTGNIGMPPYEVRATDGNGSVVTATLDLKAGDQPSSGQFPTCQ